MKNKKRKGGILKLLAMLILIPTVLLISWPISFIGTRIGRTRGGALQIPVRLYQHKETGRKVILVGAIHIGKKAYYERIQNLVDHVSTDGFQILYEGVGKMDDKDIGSLPPKQRVIVRQMKAISAFMQEVSTKLFDEDVVYQKHGLEYPDWWVRTDVEVAHVAALFAEVDLHFWDNPEDEPGEKLLEDTPEEIVWFIKTMFATAIKLLPGISTVLGTFKQFNPKKRARDHIIITMRDEVAALGILQHAEHADVLSIWGAAHIPGIHKHLSAAGYRLTATDWFDAFWT
mgnify:CR=1 FL=1